MEGIRVICPICEDEVLAVDEIGSQEFTYLVQPCGDAVSKEYFTSLARELGFARSLREEREGQR